MKLHERIDVLVKLGERLQQKDEYLDAIMHRNKFHNPWFTVDNQQQAVEAIAKQYLDRNLLEEWIKRYNVPEEGGLMKVGIVMAGNIPLVGFHDWLSVIVAGHRAEVKLSDKDPYLMPYLIKLLGEIDSRTKAYTNLTNKLTDFDAVIATGSNNSARYFEAYFGKYPNIIRKNRNGVAVLSGDESGEELKQLGRDVFDYFGLGCRNVSKIYVPEGYDFDPMLEALHEYRQIVLNTKYKNNFDYNYSLYILNKEQFKANGCILLREDKAIASRIATLHYEPYAELSRVEKELQKRKEEIQCIIASPGLIKEQPTFAFGEAQQPRLWDYADGEDTMAFLLGI